MDAFTNLVDGFGTALTPENLMYALIGAAVGTLVGVLPGLGPTAAMAILIPLTFHLPPVGAIIMLAAIFYGSQYGGTITTILLNIPGEASSAVTVLDGHAMARQGKAGAALSVAAVGSFIGGTVACIVLVTVAAPVATLALNFGPPEYVALVILGLSLILVFAGKSIVKALIMGAVGMLIATVGLDPISGAARFTFGIPQFFDGLDVVPVLMGLFGISEILINMEARLTKVSQEKVSSLVPSKVEARQASGAIARGTGVGFVLGMFPGVNATIAAFTSYIVEKRVSKTPERFGKGAIEGVAGPETANNAHANAALIPMFTLGIPGSPGVAVLMTAFIVNGLNPGPELFTQHPEVVWPIIASMYIGNVMLLVLNLPLIGLWVQILKIPYSILIGVILVFTLVGAYSIDNSMFNVWVMIAFGLLGYLFKKLDLPIAPLVLTLILGPILEDAIRQSMAIFDGDVTGFFKHPIALTIFAITAVVIVFTARRSVPRSEGDAEA
ncbi:tripartite tricarboxylate transporter permease [Asanoa iriomotensis]|uniref:DUF112 domain-containing protein n=1 Tax=Asanoa iriomotensis TaxID=234613 RepID=A0ABQ4BYC4_9ACTN|nr:tripartite tricarboxylate transporter permease [Asanoa iriomotensis]GIF55528.1 hypothetical protein Air01nite_16230 [Asanoa iriomotensis]